MRPEPVGFRWYLRSPLQVSWLATEVIPAIRYLRRTERMAVVNVRRGWRHGNHLEIIAYSGDDRAVPWAHLLARLRQPAEQITLPPQPHGTFEWVGHDDLRPWPRLSTNPAGTRADHNGRFAGGDGRGGRLRFTRRRDAGGDGGGDHARSVRRPSRAVPARHVLLSRWRADNSRLVRNVPRAAARVRAQASGRPAGVARAYRADADEQADPELGILATHGPVLYGHVRRGGIERLAHSADAVQDQ